MAMLYRNEEDTQDKHWLKHTRTGRSGAHNTNVCRVVSGNSDTGKGVSTRMRCGMGTKSCVSLLIDDKDVALAPALKTGHEHNI
jgi:hypothetical protein